MGIGLLEDIDMPFVEDPNQQMIQDMQVLEQLSQVRERNSPTDYKLFLQRFLGANQGFFQRMPPQMQKQVVKALLPDPPTNQGIVPYPINEPQPTDGRVDPSRIPQGAGPRVQGTSFYEELRREMLRGNPVPPSLYPRIKGLL